MFGPHDSLSTARGMHYIATRTLVVSVPVLVTLAAAPMLLMLLPLAFAGLPFLLVAFFPGASENRFETRRIRARQAVPQLA
jgi:hypothetical protein